MSCPSADFGGFSSLDDYNEATRRNEELDRQKTDRLWKESIRKQQSAQKEAKSAARREQRLEELKAKESLDAQEAAAIFKDQHDVRSKTRQTSSHALWLETFHSRLDNSSGSLARTMPDRLSNLSIQSHLLALSFQSPSSSPEPTTSE